MTQQSSELLLLLVLAVSARLPGVGRALIFLDDESADRPTRLLHYLSAPAMDAECDRALPDSIPVEGYFKLTTAPAQPGRRKICHTPLVPSGAPVDVEQRGIGFWFMRLRVTQLAPGQFLSVVITGYRNRHSMTLEDNDQRVDLNYRSHRYPVVLYLKNRYVRFYWNSSASARLSNPVNITAAAYARFKIGLNQTARQRLCRRHGHLWCQLAEQPSGVCIAPGGCSQQADCFDSFEEPERCPAGWFNGGNLTGLGRSAGGFVPSGTWLLRRLRWLGFAALPLALLAALARLCAQQRRLDIDENYDYKPGDEEAAAADDAAEADDDEVDDDERPLSVTAAGGADAYYSYPSCPPTPPARATATVVATLPASATVIPPTPPLPQAPIRATPTPSSKASDSVDSETGERDQRCGTHNQLPPTPPPRSRRRVSQLHRLIEEDRSGPDELLAVETKEAEAKDDVNVDLEAICLRRSFRSPAAAAAAAAASGDYTEWRSRRASVPSAAVSSRCSYTRLLNQPSPDTIEELLQRQSSAAGFESPDRVVYAQLVLPPQSAPRPPAPCRSAPPKKTRTLHFKAPSAPVAAGSGEQKRHPACMEMQPIAPKPPPRQPRRGERWADPYDLHYIVV